MLSAYGASTLATPIPTAIQTARFASEHRVSESEDGNPVVEGLRIFKVGTFTDMFGFEHTWDDFHLDQMVMHFQLLTEGNYLPDVPAREDHRMSMASVIGYLPKLYRDPADTSFLCADVEFTDPAAYEKWNRKHYRARSSEIGMYETNDGKMLFPCLLGLAFVDIGAVEGLYQRHGGRTNTLHSLQAAIDNEETPVSGTQPAQTTPPAQQPPANQPAAPAAPAAQTPPAPATPPATAAPEAQPTSQYQAPPQAQPPVQPHSFRVNGQQTHDFGAVQRHIDVLEQTIAEGRESGRKEYVAQLAKDNKITAGQVESLTAHALGLTDDQFVAFRSAYDGAPAMTMFGQQAPGANGDGQQPPPPAGATSAPDELDTALEIVTNYRRAGMALDKIKNTASFRKLEKAGKLPPELATI